MISYLLVIKESDLVLYKMISRFIQLVQLNEYCEKYALKWNRYFNPANDWHHELSFETYLNLTFFHFKGQEYSTNDTVSNISLSSWTIVLSKR